MHFEWMNFITEPFVCVRVLSQHGLGYMFGHFPDGLQNVCIQSTLTPVCGDGSSMLNESKVEKAVSDFTKHENNVP